MPRTPVYSQIVELRKQLVEVSSVKKRREIVDKLLELLKDANIRRRLVQEVAVPKGEGRVAAQSKRHIAVSKLWQVLLKTSIKYVQVILSGKAKLTSNDALFPFNLLKLCDKPVYDNEPSKLSKPLTKDLLQYCLEMLDDAPTLEIEELERDMLAMLAYICSRKEFVVHFRPDQQISAILEESERRLLADDPLIALAAARVFCNMMKTAGDLGIGLQLLISGTLSMVAKWTRKKIDNLEMIQLLLAGVDVLLKSHPDLAVAPMTRYGKPIVSLAKRSLAVKLSRPQAISVLSFLTNYVHVCQVAGKIQGLMLGDLGDIGPASLSYKSLCFMIESLFEMTDAPDAMRFELIARLLACGQRLYLCRTEWIELDDPFKSMEKELHHQRSEEHEHSLVLASDSLEEYKACSDQDLSESPFARYILSHFSISEADLSLGSQGGAESIGTSWHRIRPLLANEGVTEQSLVARIGVLTAAVDLFPLGACWATDSMSNWITVEPELFGGFRDSLSVKGSSLEDLSSVIDFVSGVIERAGGSKSVVKVQSSALFCLVRLIEASQVNFNLRRCPAESYCPLRDSLVKVWSILFSGDLYYGPPTKNCQHNSIGDFVLRLSQQIICFSGFDSNEICRLQLDIWNLPAFSTYCTKNPALFWLVYSVVNMAPLAAEGKDDSIMHPDFLFEWFPRPGDRRARLLLFCISHFHLVDDIEDKEIFTALSLCLSSLLHGPSKIMPDLPVIRWLSRMDRQRSIFTAPHSFPMAREEDIFRALWVDEPVKEETAEFDVRHYGYPDHKYFCCLSFCLQLTQKGGSPPDLVPNLTGAERFFATLEQYLRDILLRINTETDGNTAPAPSAAGCLRLLKIFSFSAIGHPHLVKQTADMYTSVFDEIDFNIMTGEEMSIFINLSSHLTRALVKMEYTDKAESFSMACSTLQDYAAMILSAFSLTGDSDAVDSGLGNETSRGSRVSCEDPFFVGAEVFGSPLANGKRKAEFLGESLGRKRPRRQTWSGPSPDFPLTFELACHAASLLLTINPRFERAAFVCESLAGVDITLGQSEMDRPIDVDGGKALIRLLCRDLLFADRSTENDTETSITSLVLNMIKMIRSQSPPDASDHLYGFDVCVQIVRERDGSLASKNLELEEVGSLIDLLYNQEKKMVGIEEKKTLLSRPNFRIRQIAASASVFESAQSLLHIKWDSVFTTKLVSPFLLDVHTRVRSIAAASVGLALRQLDQHEVIESVRKELAPIVGSLDAYREWYLRKVGERNEANVRERQLFEDAKDGLVYDVISTYWVITVVNSNDLEVVEQMVFDFVRLAATHSELQSLCFHSIDRMARLLGFANAESLLSSHRRSIAHRWLEAEDSLFEIPILVTAPSVVRRLILFNRGKIIHVPTGEESLAYERLSDYAASRFLEVAIDDFIPEIVVSACKEIVNTARTTDGRRFLLRNEYLRQMSSIFFDQYDDETVRKLLVKSLQALNSEQLILSHSEDRNNSAVSKNLDVMLDRLISNVITPKSRTSLDLSIRKIVDIVGSPGGKDRINLSVLLGHIPNKNGGSSVSSIEILLFAYYRLLCSTSRFQCLLRWQPMEQICFYICNCAQLDSGVEDLLFGLKILSDCLTRFDLAVLHPPICLSIKSLLTATTKLPFRGQDLSVVVRNLLGNTIELHFVHQQKIQADYRSWCEFTKRAHATSAGLLDEELNGMDTWGWQESHPSSSLLPNLVNKHIELVMKGTFEIVELLVSEQDKLMLSHRVIIGMWRQFQEKENLLSSLGAVIPELAAQLILKRFAETQQSVDDSMPDTSLIEISNKAMQKADIEQLEQSILAKREYDNSDFTRQLVDRLVKISIDTTDDDIRCGASRCLGELFRFTLNYQPVAVVKLDEATILKQRFIAVLEQSARTLMQLRPDTMYLAVECFKSLSCALRGKVGFSSHGRFSVASSLATVIPTAADEQFLRNSLFLSDTEVTELHRTYLDRNDEIWCWDRDLWSEKTCEAPSFENWICRITPALLVCLYKQEDSPPKSVSTLFLAQCQKLSCLDSCFASEVFMSLSLHLMLSDSDDELFKEKPRDLIIEGFTGCLNFVLESCQESKDRRYLETVVDVVDTLRQIVQERFVKDPSKSRNIDSRRWLIPFDVFSGLDGMLVATACVKVKRFKQALFFAELFATDNFEPLSLANEGRETMAGNYCSYLQLLYDSYKGLGQSDSCSAVEDYQSDYSFSSFGGTSDVRIQDSGLNRLEKLDNLTQIEGRWSTQWSLAECLADMDLKTTMGKYIAALGHSGMYDSMKKGLIEEKAAEVRLYKRQWDDSCFIIDSNHHEIDLPSIPTAEEHKSGFYCCIDRSLEFLRRDDLDSFQRCLKLARIATITELSNEHRLTDDSTVDFYLSRFNVLNKLDRLGREPKTAATALQLNYQGPRDVELCTASFPNDDILEAAVRSLPLCFIDASIREGMLNHLEVKFEHSLARGQQKRSHGILARLRSLRSSYSSADQDDIPSIVRLRIGEARLLEKSNDFHAAIRLAKLAVRTCMEGSLDVHAWLAMDSNLHPSNRLPLVAEAMTLCGIWTAKYRVEPSTFILSYQRDAVEASRAASQLPNGNNSSRTLVQALCAQAELASSIFETSERRRQSAEWQESGVTLVEREETLKHLNKKRRSKASSAEDHLRYARELTREVDTTRRSRDDFEKSIESYRYLSMQSAVQALSVANTGNFGDMSKYMYSFVSLLFSCAEDQKWSDDIDTLASQATTDIPSFRFVGLFSQLLSRLEANTHTAGSKQTLHQHLIGIVNRVSSQHPYHCIMQLIALSRSGREDKTKSGKAEAALEILTDLAKSDPKFKGDMIRIQNYLFDAYVFLALADSDQFQRGSSHKISFDNVCKGSNARLDKLSGTSQRAFSSSTPCVSTKTPDVRPRCDYGSGETDPIGSERIKGFETHFTIASSGLSRPKIVVCLGSKGGRFKQLVKGGDDTRQDAVMEQVFQYVNTLLDKKQGSPYQEQLSLATYNVIPLTSKAGVMEWVDHCAGFSHYISGKASKGNGRRRIPTAKSGAHERYFPDEWSIAKCNEVLSDPKNRSKLREVYDEVCQNFSPVYRFFFVEKFGHSAELWFQAKLRYTRSVAASSIVGHVLGIGDRHGSNIMMHQKTGEVIHIDFGIVFEQGKRLQRPERVPFRLTRNVIDGMGPLGTKGVFTTAAETTMKLLKENSNALLTILSAIVNDPLYKWTLGTCSNDRKESTSTAGSRNAAAALAISRIQEKLQGYEEGTHGEQQTVTSQVQLLVNEAMDPNNLCEMYCGWGPHF